MNTRTFIAAFLTAATMAQAESPETDTYKDFCGPPPPHGQGCTAMIVPYTFHGLGYRVEAPMIKDGVQSLGQCIQLAEVLKSMLLVSGQSSVACFGPADEKTGEVPVLMYNTKDQELKVREPN